MTKRNRRATVFDNRGEMTTTIPILPPPDAHASKRRKRHGTKEGKCHYEPPEYAMIELNGELIAPTQLPDEENRERILGGPDRVELGRLQLGPNEKVRTQTCEAYRRVSPQSILTRCSLLCGSSFFSSPSRALLAKSQIDPGHDFGQP